MDVSLNPRYLRSFLFSSYCFMACLPFSMPHWIKNLLPNKSRPSSPAFPWDTDLDLDLQYPPPVLRSTIGSRNPNREASVIECPPHMLTSLNTNQLPRRSEDTIVLPSGPNEKPVSYNTTPSLAN